MHGAESKEHGVQGSKLKESADGRGPQWNSLLPDGMGFAPEKYALHFTGQVFHWARIPPQYDALHLPQLNENQRRLTGRAPVPSDGATGQAGQAG